VFVGEQSETNSQCPHGLTLGLTARGQVGAGGGEVENTQSSPPAKSLPKGGDAIREVGGEFSVNPATNSLSISTNTRPGRYGFAPQLSLFYNLELARIGSLLFILVNSPSDQIGDEELIDTFATRLSAEPLRSWRRSFRFCWSLSVSSIIRKTNKELLR
jgi:hypothetical protein